MGAAITPYTCIRVAEFPSLTYPHKGVKTMSLCCQSIVKHYGSVVALEDASITCEHGEIRAILGGNGSGKSTLAKAIGGVITKNAGKITIDGEEVNFSSPHEAKNTVLFWLPRN
jgi:ABC-type sugar transport system ATPase subunit